ncbi:hypothetical protein JD844_001050 [Phrynosoma platyrhinos]|uniref:Uncharacterized protein n=1 Tax=Phrynosoma platyrhinos TaxID=52577 RepID=A0ABQ7TAH4_PHRPL|nr:hypothetical protein JD844_001050 [Phrynosoma platyrhinos]
MSLLLILLLLQLPHHVGRKMNSGCDWKTKVENISIEVQEAIVIGEFVSFFVPNHEEFSFNIFPAKRGKALVVIQVRGNYSRQKKKKKKKKGARCWRSKKLYIKI